MNTLAQSLQGTPCETKQYWIILTLISACLGAIPLMPLEILCPLTIIVGGILLGALFIGTTAREEFDKVFTVFFVTFLLKVILATGLATLSLADDGDAFFLSRDDAAYSIDGEWIARMWNMGYFLSRSEILTVYMPWNGSLGNYDFWNAKIYYFCGYSPFSLLYLNCLAVSLAVILVYLICREMGLKKAGIIAAWLTAFCPSLNLWATQNLKDPFLILATLAGVWSLMRLRRGFHFVACIMLGVAGILLFYFRLPLLALFMAVIPLWLFFTSDIWFLHKRRWIKVFLLCALIAFPFMNVIRARISIHHILGIPGDTNIFHWIDFNRSVRAYGATAFMPDVDLSSPLAILKFLPVGMFVAIFSPFPWQLGSSRQIVSAPEMLLVYLLFPYAIAGISYIWKNRYRETALIAAVMLTTFSFIALFDANIGTMFRHKSIVFPFIIIFIAQGYCLKKEEALAEKKGVCAQPGRGDTSYAGDISETCDTYEQ
ncbi:MAG: glycosyltransferase family 39 protein [Candidatus Omnitrophica bacterium]|nr:glycosyltransferase family 39 protein [Candidatus Omnitrophota bacterium]